MATAIGLFSGGLDSILAARLIQQQGITVIPLAFVTPFFGPATARRAVAQLHTDLMEVDITESHFAMVRNPRYGYGRYLNPCIDCHGPMFPEAGRIMERLGADFLFSGEVLGERPMSQNRNSLALVAKLSGYGDLIVRPLSARLLPETRPEAAGIVDRSQLQAIEGRSRKPQLALARQLNLAWFPEPAGGCKLTEPGFSRRLRDLLDHCAEPSRHDLELLHVGRHLRVAGGEKIIAGRNQSDNERLATLAHHDDILLAPADISGPTVLVPAPADAATVEMAARVCLRYSRATPDTPYAVTVTRNRQRTTITARACSEQVVREMLR